MNNTFAILRINQNDKPNSRLSLLINNKLNNQLNNQSYYDYECIDNSYDFCPLSIYKRDGL